MLASQTSLLQLSVMSVDGIKEALHQVPFRPFKIRMTSGKEYNVDHPDFVAASRTYRRLYVISREEDRMEMIETLLIENIEHLGSAALSS